MRWNKIEDTLENRAQKLGDLVNPAAIKHWTLTQNSENLTFGLNLVPYGTLSLG